MAGSSPIYNVEMDGPFTLTHPFLLLETPAMAPRPSSFIALAAFLILGIVLLQHQFPTTPSFYRDVSGRGRPLSAWLTDEEARYAEVVQGRQQLITKWGPTAAEVES
jgi:hypothetical protein